MLYYLCGLGTDARLWQPLQAAGLPGHVLEYPRPFDDDNLETYAGRWAAQLDLGPDAILVGMSFGGLMAQALGRLLQPKALILISTIKHKDELPPYFRSLRNLAPFVSGQQLRDWHHALAKAFYRIQPQTGAGDLIVDMLGKADPALHHFVVRSVLNWAPDVPPANYLHIHGTRDNTFPARYLREPIAWVPGGSHVMVLDRAPAVAQYMRMYLEHIDHPITEPSSDQAV